MTGDVVKEGRGYTLQDLKRLDVVFDDEADNFN
jgi:hypothetical protein